MITKNKVLIIKLGHSETLDAVISKECSLGDVVRTTVILNYFSKGDSITWLVDEKAAPLLVGIQRIKRILTWSLETALQLESEFFDVVVNLEKHPGVCALASRIHARQKFGFYFGTWKGEAEAHFHTEKVLEIATVPGLREKSHTYWQQHLAMVLNRRWSIKDKYLLADREVKEEPKIGLNYLVGEKWEGKEWSDKNWSELARRLTYLGYTISWQTGRYNLETYMDWIASCACIISCDSLGMHLGIAYSRRVIALFGPTPSKEVYLYEKGEILDKGDGYTDSISVSDVMEAVRRVYPLENEMDTDKAKTV